MTADLVTFGETMVALRWAGPLTIRGALTARIAGAESNVAIGLARLGHTARWVSRVGDDRASAVAASCVSTRGDYEGLPTRSELERLPLSPGTAIR